MFNQALYAFMGAFFAFLFVRIGEMLTKLYEREVKNYNALIRLEYSCNENVDSISNNIWIIEDFVSIMDAGLNSNQPVIYANKMHLIKFDDNILLNLSSIDFINKIFDFKITLSRVNNDIDTLNSMGENFKGNLMQGNINYDTYKINMRNLIAKSLELKKFLKSLESKTVGIVACAEVLSKKQKPLFTRIMHFMCCKRAFSKKFDEEVKAQIIQIEKDRAQISTKSQEEINEIKRGG
nr:hypothetical protein [Candidatus Omnitrophota bacterium]